MKSEAAILVEVRLAATERGMRVWRNNVGAGALENGSYLRWGLANESPQMNASLKSSDLIGINPVLITPAHVGSVIGQFVSLECKKPGWKYAATDRERAQQAWLTLINSLGGYARFTDGSEI